MVVERVPQCDSDAELLRELLAPHGLTVSEGPGGSFLVVRVPASGTLRGTVRLAGGGRLPSPARIRVDRDGPTTTTGRRGGFELEVEAGSHVLDVRAKNYTPRVVPGVHVRPGATTDIVVELNPRAVLEETVVVNSPRTSEGIAIAPETLDATPEISGDAMRAVARLPGAAGSDLSAGINVRGGGDDELLVVLDGLEIHEPFHVRDLGGGFLGLIDRDDVGGIEFFRGGFPVRYGNRMSGVLDIMSANPTTPSRTSIGFQSGQGRVSSRGRFGADRGLWLVSARAGQPEYALPAWISEDDYDPLFYDLLGKVQVRVGPHATIAVHALWGFDEGKSKVNFDPANLDEDATLVDTTYGNRYVWVTIRTAWNARLAAETVVSQGEIDRERRVGIGGLSAVNDERDFEFGGVTQDWTFDAGAHDLQWGAGFRILRAKYGYTTFSTDGDQLLSVRPSGNEIYAYLSDTVRLSKSLELETGLRWDAESYTGLNEGAVAPRIHLAWLPTDRLVTRLGWGRYHQAQRIYELQVEDGVDHFFKAEAAEHFLAGIAYTRGSAWSVELNAYYKETDDARPKFENLFDPTGLLPEAQTDRVLVAPDHAQMRGVEIEFRTDPDRRIAGQIGYAIAKADDRIDGADVPRTWDQRHAVDATAAFRIGSHWLLGLSGTYHSGWPTTAVTAESVDGEVVLVPGPRNRERFPSYLRFDARARREFRFGRHLLSLQADMLNLLDRKNVCCVAGFETFDDGDGPEVRRLLKNSLSRTVFAGAVWQF